EVDRNRALAWRAILGDDDHEQIQRDIMTVAIAVDPRDRLRHVAQTMAAGWLETVLSWPRRFVAPFEGDAEGDAEIAFAACPAWRRCYGEGSITCPEPYERRPSR